MTRPPPTPIEITPEMEAELISAYRRVMRPGRSMKSNAEETFQLLYSRDPAKCFFARHGLSPSTHAALYKRLKETSAAFRELTNPKPEDTASLKHVVKKPRTEEIIQSEASALEFLNDCCSDFSRVDIAMKWNLELVHVRTVFDSILLPNNWTSRELGFVTIPPAQRKGAWAQQEYYRISS